MISMHIATRDFSLTPAVQTLVKKHVSKLERIYRRIRHCDVTISIPHKHHHKGKVYHVAIRLLMPGGDLVVNRESEEDTSHESLQMAVHDAFASLGRRGEARVRKMRGQVKGHAQRQLTHGRIKQIFPEQNYGLLESDEDAEVYFHRNCLKAGAFEKLAAGDAVVFEIEEGEKGPQAVYVRHAKDAKRGEAGRISAA